MHPHISQLSSIASKDSRRIIGLMSGTSLDGLDIALCRIEGSGIHTRVNLEQFTTVPYNNRFREEVRSVFSRKEIDLEHLTLLNPWVARQHALMILECLDRWEINVKEVDLIASHGQTIYHAPHSLHGKEGFGSATLQIGDGDHLSVITGIITLSDFRQKHIAGGGEGAPLAAYGDYLIFSHEGEDRILLNIGGIANFTFLSHDLDPLKVICTDTGPGNTLMDVFVQKQFQGRTYDENADLARLGEVNELLLRNLMDHPYFHLPFPKTTGPELFNLSYLEAALRKMGGVALTPNDILATLNRFSSLTITRAIQQLLPSLKNKIIYFSGGGAHNPMLMENIRKDLSGFEFRSTVELGIPPDAKEAVLFAVLANETLAGSENLLQNLPAGIPGLSMGKISFPD